MLASCALGTIQPISYGKVNGHRSINHQLDEILSQYTTSLAIVYRNPTRGVNGLLWPPYQDAELGENSGGSLTNHVGLL